MEAERVNPARVTDKKTGMVYELDFNREAIRFAEIRGFRIDELTTFPVTKIPEFFYYAFRKNHKKVPRDKTDDLLEKMGGLSPKLLERLIQLYQQVSIAHTIADEEDLEKNESVTVEL